MKTLTCLFLLTVATIANAAEKLPQIICAEAVRITLKPEDAGRACKNVVTEIDAFAVSDCARDASNMQLPSSSAAELCSNVKAK